MEQGSPPKLTQDLGEDLRGYVDQSFELKEDELADIFCILHPASKSAIEGVERIVQDHPEFTFGNDIVGADVQMDENNPDAPDAAVKLNQQKDLVLRLSHNTKDPLRGFVFGREPLGPKKERIQERSKDPNDMLLYEPNSSRISRTHFRIYINEFGTIMLEDLSFNGTLVDGHRLQAKEKENGKAQYTLEHGSMIKIIMMPSESDNFVFMVRIPRREGEVEGIYENNLLDYYARINAIKLLKGGKDANPSGPSPPVLFPRAHSESTSGSNITRHAGARRWKGGDKYNIVRKIGQGAFATVYKITQKNDGRAFAAKEIDKRKFAKDGNLDSKIDNELQIMRKVHHENIVQFVEYVDHFDELYIIMEMIEGGDLGRLIQTYGVLSEERVRDMASQLLSALGHLHERGITHRDIKPDNIMLSSHEPIVVKLTDFGLSKMVMDSETFMRTFCGTLLYCAPEVYHEFYQYDRSGRYNPERSLRNVARDPYTAACDLWSMAGVLFFSLCSAPPYPVVGNTVQYQDLLHTVMTSALDIRPLQNQNLSEDCIQFIKDMLQKWPEMRPSIKNLQAHAWITGIPASQKSSQSTDDDDDDGDEDEVDLISDPDATELAQNASQLSMDDGDENDEKFGSLEEIDRDNLGLSMQRSYEINSNDSMSESFAFMKNGPGNVRLFGELGSSALGSSGVVANQLLNLPTSEHGAEQSQFDSDLSDVPSDEANIHPAFRNGGRAELAEDLGSLNPPSLTGAESVFGNLQVRSPSAAPSPRSEISGSSNPQSPENNAHQGTRPTPSFVTAPSTSVRRQREVNDDMDASEPSAKRQKNHSVDGSVDGFMVDKTYWWDTRDTSTWHDDYPSLTLGELRALEAEATAQGKKYVPPRTTATPNYSSTGFSKDCTSSTPSINYGDKSSSAKDANEVVKSDSFREVPRRILARFVAEQDCALPSIVVNITEQFSSWGRSAHNSHQYSDGVETRISKYALKLVLWSRGMGADATLEASDAAFYIATKALSGLQVNGVRVLSHQRDNIRGQSKYWAQLKHGDLVSIWNCIGERKQSIVLKFECYFGSSKQPRNPDEPVVFVSEGEDLEDLEATVFRREQDLYTEMYKKKAVRSYSTNMQQQRILAASGTQLTTSRPSEGVANASTLLSTTSKSGSARARGGGPLARVRGESGVSMNLPQTFDGCGDASSKQRQSSLFVHNGIQPGHTAAARLDTSLNGSTQSRGVTNLPSANRGESRPSRNASSNHNGPYTSALATGGVAPLNVVRSSSVNRRNIDGNGHAVDQTPSVRRGVAASADRVDRAPSKSKKTPSAVHNVNQPSPASPDDARGQSANKSFSGSEASTELM